MATGITGLMDRRRWRARRTARLSLAAALLLAAPLVGRMESADGAPATALAVTGDLPRGHVLAETDLTPAPLPTDALPDGALDREASAVGARLSGPVRRGEVLTDAGLDGPPGTHTTRDDHRVVPVPLADPAVADLLGPGDLVDLVTPADVRSVGAPDPVARGARVRDVPPGRPGGQRTLLVEVPEADAARLAATAAGVALAVLVHG